MISHILTFAAGFVFAFIGIGLIFDLKEKPFLRKINND